MNKQLSLFPPVTVVILSRSDDNIKLAVQSVRHNDPTLPIIVIDDGLHPLTWPVLKAWGVRRIVPVVRWLEQPDGSFVRQPRDIEFVFARNANLGIRAAFNSGSLAAVLMNDDCALQTPGGFSHLYTYAESIPDFGLISASFDTATLPWQQQCQLGSEFSTVSSLMFPCVLIPREVFVAVGPLDESFVHYGFDDVDYCDRVRAAGYLLAVDHGCYVTHSGRSEYRSRSNWRQLMAANQLIYERKKAHSNV